MRLRFAVLASLLAVVAGMAATGIANAAPRHNHHLTINATPNPIQAGDGVLVYGQLEGTDIVGKTIRLYQRVDPGRSFSLIGTATTNSFGFYELPEGVVLSNASWFVRGPDASHSRTIRERVAPLVSLSPSAITAKTFVPITFSGQVIPNHAGERVLLQERNGSSNSDDWTTLKSDVLEPGSTYSIAYAWRTPGERDVRVVFPQQDHRNIRGESDPVSVTIQQTEIPDFTINASAPIIPDGSAVTILGSLFKPGSTTPVPAGTSVTLWGRHADQARFSAITSTVTNSHGGYSFTQQPTQNTVYVVQTTFRPHRHTAYLFVGVRDVLTLAATSTTSTVGGKVFFVGSVTPDKRGRRVYLQRLGRDGDWHPVEVRRVRFDSTFVFSWTFGSAGTREFRARIYSDENNVGAASAPVTITVMGVAPVTSLPSAS